MYARFQLFKRCQTFCYYWHRSKHRIFAFFLFAMFHRAYFVNKQIFFATIACSSGSGYYFPAVNYLVFTLTAAFIRTRSLRNRRFMDSRLLQSCKQHIASLCCCGMQFHRRYIDVLTHCRCIFCAGDFPDPSTDSD